MDWLVIVGSYQSLSVALIGVKAKQSASNSSQVSVQHQGQVIPQPPLMVPPPNIQLSTPPPQSLDMYTPPCLIRASPQNTQQTGQNVNGSMLGRVQQGMNQNKPDLIQNSEFSSHTNQYQNSNFIRPQQQSVSDNNNSIRFQMPPPQFPPPLSNQRPLVRPPNQNFNPRSPNHMQFRQPFHLNNNRFSSPKNPQLKSNGDQSNLSEQRTHDQKPSQLDSEVIESDLTKTDLDESAECVKLQENVTESDLSAYLDLNEAKDELEMINSTRKNDLMNTKNLDAINDLDILSECFEIDLTKGAQATPKPTLTKYEQIYKNVKVNEALPDIYKSVFHDDDFHLNESGLNEMDQLTANMNKSMELCHIVVSGGYLDRLNELIVRMLDSGVISSQVEINGEKGKSSFIFQMRKLRLGIKLANLVLTKIDSESSKSLILQGIQSKLVSLIEDTTLLSEPMRLKCLGCLTNSLLFKDGMQYFLKTNLHTRVLTFFNSFNETSESQQKPSSRLIIAFSNLLTQVSFYEYLGLFTAKCHEMFVTKKAVNYQEYAHDLFDVLELIYAHCMRFIKLNPNCVTQVFMKGSERVGESGNFEENGLGETESINGIEEPADTKHRKKFKSSDHKDAANQKPPNLYYDDSEDQYNQFPMQCLFDKFPHKLVLTTVPQALTPLRLLLRWFDEFETLKYLLMLAAYVYDNAHYSQNRDLFIKLNGIIENFFNDILDVTQANEYSHCGLEYLLNKPELTKCMLNVLVSQRATTSSDMIGKCVPVRSRFYSNVMKRISKSIQGMSVIDSLKFNLNQIRENIKKSLKKDPTEDLSHSLNILVDSVNHMQSLAFLLNDPTYSQIIVNCFSAPDGNMSNNQLDCLLNWLEFSIIEKHYLQLKNTESNTLVETTRCYMLNALIDVFHILCRSNQHNWGLCDNSNTEDQLNDNILILTLSTTERDHRLIDYKQNLKRLSQYASLLVNNLSAIRLRAATKTGHADLTEVIYKLKTIRSYIEPFVVMSEGQATDDTNDEISLAKNLAACSSFYYKIDFLNRIIEFVKKSYEKNLNMFFLKQYYACADLSQKQMGESLENTSGLPLPTPTQVPKITSDYLNSTITTLNILKNIIQDLQPPKTADLTLNLAKYSLDARIQFKAKRYLGHLISRNVLQTLLCLIEKLNDCLIFYTNVPNSKFSTRKLNSTQIDSIVSLIEPAALLVKSIIKSLIRNEKFKDVTPLEIMFRFNAVFCHCILFSLNEMRDKDQVMIQRADLIRKSVIEICILYAGKPNSQIKHQNDMCKDMYDELLQHIIERPFNFTYGLSMFSELLPLPLPIPMSVPVRDTKTTEVQIHRERDHLSRQLERLFVRKHPRRRSFFKKETCLKDSAPIFVKFIRLLAVTSSETTVNDLLKLSDLSEDLCSNLIKALLDYAIEIFGELTNDNVFDQQNDQDMVHNLPMNNFTQSNEIITNSIDDNKNEVNRIETINQMDTDEVFNDYTPDIDSIYDTGLIDESSQTRQELTEAGRVELQAPGLSEQVTQVSQEIGTIDGQFDLGKTDLEVNGVDENFQLDVEQKRVFYQAMFTQCFSRVMQFLSSLLGYERPGAELNPMRAVFMSVCTELPEKRVGQNDRGKNVYLNFFYDCVKFCNRADLSGDQRGYENVVQQEIYGLIESMLRYTPELFFSSISLNCFQFDEIDQDQPELDTDNNCEYTDQNRFQPILNIFQRTLIEHVSKAKLASLDVTNAVLSCLTTLCQLYRAYFFSLITENLASTQNYINPMFKSHLKVANSLSNFVKELDTKFEISTEYMKLLAKFLTYINLTIEDLRNGEDKFPVDVGKLKELFKWSNSNFNITDLHIDSISICKTIKTRPTNENSLDNLLVLVVNGEQSTNKEVHDLDTKIKCCACQIKMLVNRLNEVRNTDVENISDDLDLKQLVDISKSSGKIPSKSQIVDFFVNRNVYSSNPVSAHLKEYDNGWCKPILNIYSEKSIPRNDSIEINPEIEASYLEETIDMNTIQLFDKTLHQKLKYNLIYLDLDDLFMENLQTPEDIKTDNKELDSPEDTLTKFKNSNVINTRTGLKYKAPMRGGHSNPGQRNASGNGSVGSGQQNMARLHDSFRTRLPNTSRPPSLHVDEFYRLENAKQQQGLNNNGNGSGGGSAMVNNNNLVSIDTTSNDTVNDTNKSLIDTNEKNDSTVKSIDTITNTNSENSTNDNFKKQSNNMNSSTNSAPVNKSNLDMEMVNSMDSSRKINNFTNSPNQNQDFNNIPKEPWKRNLSNPSLSNINELSMQNSMMDNSDNSGQFRGRYNSAQFSNNLSNNLSNSRERSLSTGNLSNINNQMGLNEGYMNMTQMLPPTLIPPPQMQAQGNGMSPSMQQNNSGQLLNDNEKMVDPNDRPTSYSPSDNSLSNLKNHHTISPKLIQQQSPPPMLNVIQNQQMPMHLQFSPPMQGGMQGLNMMPLLNNGMGQQQVLQHTQFNQPLNQQQNQQRFQMRGGYRGGRRMFPTNNFSNRPQYQR